MAISYLVLVLNDRNIQRKDSQRRSVSVNYLESEPRICARHISAIDRRAAEIITKVGKRHFGLEGLLRLTFIF